jgi:hypothetical protein
MLLRQQQEFVRCAHNVASARRLNGIEFSTQLRSSQSVDDLDIADERAENLSELGLWDDLWERQQLRKQLIDEER